MSWFLEPKVKIKTLRKLTHRNQFNKPTRLEARGEDVLTHLRNRFLVKTNNLLYYVYFRRPYVFRELS